MSSSSGAYFRQSCHVTKACVSLNWHQRRQTCRVLRRESWRSACCHQQCAATVVYSSWCISATLWSFHWGSAARHIRLSKFRSRQKQWRASVEDWRVEPIGVAHPLWKISGYATGWHDLDTTSKQRSRSFFTNSLSYMTSYRLSIVTFALGRTV